jgi:hypothetical protein
MDRPGRTARVNFGLRQINHGNNHNGGWQGRGVMLANLLEMAAFTKAPKVFWGQPLDAFRSNTQSFKSFVGGCAYDDVLCLQSYFAFIPATQSEDINDWKKHHVSQGRIRGRLDQGTHHEPNAGGHRHTTCVNTAGCLNK